MPSTDPIRAALREAALVYRVQDRDGRGPFKPGMTYRWRDADGHDFPPVQVEFGLGWRDEIPHGWHCGCAFRDVAKAGAWFSAWECDRLAALGYHLVALGGCRVLRESSHQIIVVRPRPLRAGAVICPWPHRRSACLDAWKEDVERAARGGEG